MNENINREIIVLGTLEVEGMKFHDIEGGFGKDKKAMLVKDIAEIHNRESRQINELINKNRKRFKDGKDILDLLG
ncbi:ORF6N domain-containing protein, partial [Clostridioides difficile]|nr:ORF6N domain-containing protein [Clostridioides difficile]